MKCLAVFMLHQMILLCRSMIYHNQFAVHVPDGEAVAEQVAARSDMENIGQIGDLENFFIFTSHQINKRSVAETFLLT
jgi:hypothetical protein